MMFWEKQIQLKLSKKLNARMEVCCPVGRIDLLTNTEIIEVKYITNWKHAIGQINAYSYFYPNHKKVIYLFGLKYENIYIAEKICLLENILVRYVY
jgi:hypothetical protein